MKALLVGVDPSLHPSLSALLRTLGCRDVVVARTGEDAMAVARDRFVRIDLVLFDLDTHGGDGLVACRRLAGILVGVPIVACSAHGDEQRVIDAFDAGAHDFVPTPLRLGELAVRLRATLRIRDERVKRAEQEQRLVQWTRRLEQTKRDLESAVCIDPLTGIANRRHFDNLLRSEWRRAARDGTELSLVVLDLDHFHGFNDRYGHVGGDACLVRVAKAMAHSLRRASDVLARYGGEEIVAILPETGASGACVVAERLRACVEELEIPNAGSTCSAYVTLSAGVATRRPTPDSGPDELVKAADAAMYRAKNAGRNRCRGDGVDAEHVVVSRQPWPICPVVIADPILVQRVPKFLDALRAEVVPAILAAREGDLALAAILGHSVRRIAAQFGFEQLGELGHRIADVTRGEEPELVASVVGELGWYLEHVQIVYRRSARLRAMTRPLTS